MHLTILPAVYTDVRHLAARSSRTVQYVKYDEINLDPDINQTVSHIEVVIEE